MDRVWLYGDVVRGVKFSGEWRGVVMPMMWGQGVAKWEGSIIEFLEN